MEFEVKFEMALESRLDGFVLLLLNRFWAFTVAEEVFVVFEGESRLLDDEDSVDLVDILSGADLCALFLSGGSSSTSSSPSSPSLLIISSSRSLLKLSELLRSRLLVDVVEALACCAAAVACEVDLLLCLPALSELLSGWRHEVICS